MAEARLHLAPSARRAAERQRPRARRRPTSYFEHRQPYFFDYVENKLIERLRGRTRCASGGLEVYTTIDPELQEVGLEAMRSALPYSTDPSSALVSIDPRNGQIRAMVSSSSYDSSQFNLAAQGHRQPGSTFKTFVLTTAIKQGIDPYSTYYTSKPLDLDLPEWGHWDVAHRRRGLPGHGQPAAGDGRLRQHRLRPARPRRRARERSPRRRTRWGSPPRSTGSRPRGSAACGSASRRWRCPTPTRPSPPAASTATRSRSAGSSSPAAGSTSPSSPTRGGSSPKRSPTR